jgi:hypothetical protein
MPHHFEPALTSLARAGQAFTFMPQCKLRARERAPCGSHSAYSITPAGYGLTEIGVKSRFTGRAGFSACFAVRVFS